MVDENVFHIRHINTVLCAFNGLHIIFMSTTYKTVRVVGGSWLQARNVLVFCVGSMYACEITSIERLQHITYLHKDDTIYFFVYFIMEKLKNLYQIFFVASGSGGGWKRWWTVVVRDLWACVWKLLGQHTCLMTRYYIESGNLINYGLVYVERKCWALGNWCLTYTF